MRSLILLAFVIGVAYCAPQVLYYPVDYKTAPQAYHVAPAAARPSEIEILLAAQNPAVAGVPAQPVRGYIKHRIPQAAGKDSVEVLYPFNFAQPAPAIPAIPAVPAVPVYPAVHAVRKDDDDDLDD